MAREPFVWGQGGAQLTPKQLEDRRKMAQALMAKGADFSPAGHWTEALGRAFNGWWGGKQAGRFNRQEEEATAAARAKMEGRYSPVATALAGGSGGGGYTPPKPQSPWVIGSDSVAPQNEITPGGLAMGMEVNTSSPDYIRQGMIERGIPGHIADGFMMNFMDESGLNPGINEISPTVPGSRGGFGLYQLTGPRRVAYENFAAERGVDPSNVDAQLDWLMYELQGPESAAANAIFAAPDAGSAGAAIVNEFLRPAAEHRTSRASRYAGGSPSVATGATSNDIYALMADPWVMDQYGSVLGSELAGVQQRENTVFNDELRRSDPMYAMDLERQQLELEAMKNPGKRPPIQVGDVLLDADTLQPVYDGRLPATPEAPETQVFYDDATGQEYRAQWNPSTMTWDRVGGVKAGAEAAAPVTKNVTLSDGSEVMVQWNPEKRVWDAAPIPEGGTLGTGGGAGLTESQAKTTLFATLQNETAPVLSQIESIWDPANIGDAAARSTPIAGNFFKSEQGQIYDAGAAAWAEGALRISTGAAATEPEIARVKNTYFAQPGDTPNVVEFKRQMREMYSRAIQASLGNPAAGGDTLTLPEDFAKRYMSTNPMPSDTSTTEVVPDGIDPAEWEYMTPEEKALFQ